MIRSENTQELMAALARAQGDIKPAARDSSNPFFKSSYADLASVWEACRVPLSKNGLCVIQTTEKDEHGTYLETTLGHSSGQWISGRIYLNPKANDPQAVGSAITYYRRYALQAIVGIAPDDDDGETAMSRGPAQAAPNHPINNVSQVQARPAGAAPAQRAAPAGPNGPGGAER